MRRFWLVAFLILLCCFATVAIAADGDSSMPPESSSISEADSGESVPDVSLPPDSDLPTEFEPLPMPDNDAILAALSRIEENQLQQLAFLNFYTYGLLPLGCALFILWQGCKWFSRTFIH